MVCCEQYVAHVLLAKVSAFDEYGLATGFEESLSGAMHIGLVVDGYAREEGGLVGIGRNEGRPGEEQIFHGRYHIVFVV